MEILAGLGSPGADAALGAADLDHIGDRGAVGDAPVKPVTAEIGEPAAIADVIPQRV